MQPDVIVRPEGSIGLGPFHSKSKVHAEKEEVSEDRWRESILLECTAEDDPVLDRPKSQNRKVLRRPRQSPWKSQKGFQALQASHKSMVEKQPQEKLSPPH